MFARKSRKRRAHANRGYRGAFEEKG